jgi:hypothetical protein
VTSSPSSQPRGTGNSPAQPSPTTPAAPWKSGAEAPRKAPTLRATPCPPQQTGKGTTSQAAEKLGNAVVAWKSGASAPRKAPTLRAAPCPPQRTGKGTTSQAAEKLGNVVVAWKSGASAPRNNVHTQCGLQPRWSPLLSRSTFSAVCSAVPQPAIGFGRARLPSRAVSPHTINSRLQPLRRPRRTHIRTEFLVPPEVYVVARRSSQEWTIDAMLS